MKTTAFIVSLIFTLPAAAQTGNGNMATPFETNLGFPLQDLSKAKLINATNHSKLYALPLDGMPCLVPNLKEVAKIPNGLNYPLLSAMGNPFKKHELLPPMDETQQGLNNSLLLNLLHKNKGNNLFLSK